VAADSAPSWYGEALGTAVAAMLHGPPTGTQDSPTEDQGEKDRSAHDHEKPESGRRRRFFHPIDSLGVVASDCRVTELARGHAMAGSMPSLLPHVAAGMAPAGVRSPPRCLGTKAYEDGYRKTASEPLTVPNRSRSQALRYGRHAPCDDLRWGRSRGGRCPDLAETSTTRTDWFGPQGDGLYTFLEEIPGLRSVASGSSSLTRGPSVDSRPRRSRRM
jgi:hypothetical protein